MDQPPTIEQIRAARAQLGERVRTTPLWRWRSDVVAEALGEEAEVLLKLELFQETGTFKARGALLHALALSDGEKARGVTTVSAGNHAIAVAYAARSAGCHAKVVMPKTANPFRLRRCERLGAEVTLAKDVHEAFELVERIRRDEGRVFIHPFESPRTSLGTATLGLEIAEQAEGLDAVVVPIGGGGLISGLACAVKQLQPSCEVFGVEPEGAASMRASLAAGKPLALEKVETIADSLAAPHAAPYSFNLCQRYVDEVVLVSDEQLQAAMALLMAQMKLAVEPAGAAATAALFGPLRDRLAGRRVCALVCGTNIDAQTHAQHVQQGFAALSEALGVEL